MEYNSAPLSFLGAALGFLSASILCSAEVSVLGAFSSLPSAAVIRASGTNTVEATARLKAVVTSDLSGRIRFIFFIALFNSSLFTAQFNSLGLLLAPLPLAKTHQFLSHSFLVIILHRD